ncbi:MAG TPA: trimeric intracellular cation channel family protein [Ferruginibacter sp.]|nr:trimeric intracellular cation channel family protein [Ferruginibacter sp.]
MDLSFLHIIEVLGTFSFAVSGASFAMEKKLDPFGVLILSFVTAIGGGTLRDVMIGNLPVGWLRDETATTIIFTGALGTLLFDKYLKKLTTTLFLFDALGLGLFTLVGIEKAIQLNFSIGVCIALGTITASFGGVIRDVLLNNVPLVFRKEIYALASIIGGLVYFILKETNLDSDLSTIICILLIFIIRIVAVKFKISLPLFYTKLNK